MREVMLGVLAGELASEELPRIAAEAIVEGQDVPALRELAGLSRSEYREARELLARVVEELDGIPGSVENVHAMELHAGSKAYAGTIAAVAHLVGLKEDGL